MKKLVILGLVLFLLIEYSYVSATLSQSKKKKTKDKQAKVVHEDDCYYCSSWFIVTYRSENFFNHLVWCEVAKLLLVYELSLKMLSYPTSTCF